MQRSLSILLAALALVGCGGLRVNLVDSAYQRPSNVAVYFTVDGPDGEPIPGLQADDFRIYEDGQLVSEAESQQTIVNPEVAAEHYTLVLVDMSGSVSESDQVPLIEAATQELTAQLGQHQKVAIYAFDGSEEIHRITPFTQSAGAVNAGAGRLSSFRPRDPSTNLHGAVVAAIQELDRELERARAPLRFGTIVVFTDGSDRAARVTQQEMGRAIVESPYDIFAIGVGDEISESVLGYIGREGYVMVDETAALSAAFQRIGERILAMTQRYYLLSYCSPARAGTHTVTVEAVTDTGRGAVTYEFDAQGFGPNCNPSQPPPFDTSQGGATPRQRARAGRGARIEVRAPRPHVRVEATVNPEEGAQ